MVKKCCYFIEVFLLILLLCCCGTHELEKSDTENHSVEKLQSEKPAGETDMPSQEKDVELEKINMEEETNYLNDYFPYKNDQTVSLAGRLLDYLIEGDIILRFHKEMEGNAGELWLVTIAEIEDAEKSKEEIKEALSIRDSLYYFFVTKTKIYWIEKEKLSGKKKKEICEQGQLPKYTDVVCQNKKKDVNRDGWHYRIITDEKNFISYSAYFKLEQEASYLRGITFKKGDGIVKFSSQTTLAGAESIELWDERFYQSEEYAVIERY